MYAVVTGSRNWTAREPIHARLSQLPATTVVRHGGARGADAITDGVCKDLGISVDAIKADWRVKPGTPPWRIKHWHGQPYDSQAGFARNDELVQWLAAQVGERIVLAFADDLAESHGSADCVQRALRAGIVVEHHTLTGVTLLGDTQAALF